MSGGFRQPLYHDAIVDSTPLPRVALVDRREADRRALRAFWRGVLLGAVVAASLGWAAAARGESISISGSPVSIALSDVPGELAVVTFENVQVNGAHDNGSRVLAGAGLVVEILFLWGADLFGADRITVLPPDGVICRPASCEATVLEGFVGSVVLLEWLGG